MSGCRFIPARWSHSWSAALRCRNPLPRESHFCWSERALPSSSGTLPRCAFGHAVLSEEIVERFSQNVLDSAAPTRLDEPQRRLDLRRKVAGDIGLANATGLAGRPLGGLWLWSGPGGARSAFGRVT